MAITAAELSELSNVTVRLTNSQMEMYYNLERGRTIDLKESIANGTLFRIQPVSKDIGIATLILSDTNELLLDKNFSPGWTSAHEPSDFYEFIFKDDKARLRITLSENDTKIIIVGTVPTP